MKHIFTVHSNLTFLIAYSTAKQLGLDWKDVIFFANRFKVPFDGLNVVPAYPEARAATFIQKVRYFNIPRSFDAYIDEITEGEPYTAYIDLASYYQKILITNPRCVRFHFFEEGNSAYMAEDDLTDLTWENHVWMSFRERNFFSRTFLTSIIRVIRGFNLRLLGIPYHYMAFVNFRDIRFFSFSDNAFYNAPKEKKVRIIPDRNDPNLKKLAKGVSLQNAIVWIDGSNRRFTGLDESVYYKAIDKAIDIILKKQWLEKGMKLYLKLKPGLEDHTGVYLADTLTERKIPFEVLPGDINLECLFMLSDDCKVLGVSTAALEYAHAFGQEVYTIYNLFEQRSATFLDKMTGFWNNLIELKE